MDIVQSYLNSKKENIQKELAIIQLMDDVYNWFIQQLPLEYTHKDIRGNYTNIILSTFDEIHIDGDLIQQSFENSIFYNDAKNNLISFGYLYTKNNNKTHFYIQNNSDIKSLSNTSTTMKTAILNRVEHELFPHIDKYLNK